MSLTLEITERRSSDMHLKNPLALIIAERFGNEVDERGIEFLRGLMAGLSDTEKGEREVLKRMIERIEEGAIFDLRKMY